MLLIQMQVHLSNSRIDSLIRRAKIDESNCIISRIDPTHKHLIFKKKYTISKIPAHHTLVKFNFNSLVTSRGCKPFWGKRGPRHKNKIRPTLSIVPVI